MADFLKQMEKTYYVPRTLLNVFGLTPGDKSKFGKLRAGLFTFFLVFVNQTLINAAYCDWPNIPKVVLRVNILAGTMLALSKLTMFLIHRDDIAILLKIMQENFWNEAGDDEEEKKLLKSYGQMAFKWNIWVSVTVIGIWPLAVIRQFKWLLTVIFNSDLEHPIPRMLWAPNWYSSYIDVHATPYFQLIFISQITGAFCACATTATLDSMFFYFVMSICAQFRLLQERIKKFNTQRNEKDNEQNIFKCLQYHQKLGKICDDLNKCYTWVLFYQCLFTCFYLCLCAYVLILYRSNKTFIVYKSIGIVATIIMLFASCYCADYLATETVAVADAAYDCNWVDAPKNIKQIIQIIIMRAQKPIYAEISGFAPATLATFETILRFSYSVLTMLRTTLTE